MLAGVLLMVAGASGGLLSSGLRPEVKIIQGYNAPLGMLPWQAWIESILYTFRSSVCGGSLISERHVLTAAHCVTTAMLCKISLGTVSLNEGGISFYEYSKNIAVHEGYDSTRNINDIAIVRLSSPVMLTANIRPIRLPTVAQTANSLSEGPAMISGWGRTSNNEPTYHNYLQYGIVTIMPQESCKAFYMEMFSMTIGDSHICTFQSSSNVCSGDSGGPLAIFEQDNNWTLVGIVSLGLSPCIPGAPAVFTAVSHYLPWINYYTQ